MQVQAVNNHAAGKYLEFDGALTQVALVLADTAKYVRRMKDTRTGMRFQGFQVPDKKEVDAARVKAEKQLDVLRKKAKEYESELMSRGWRV